MRMDYILYVVAIVFFIVTLTALVYPPNMQSVWIVSTVVVGLAFVGFGYTQRPRTTASSMQTGIIESSSSQAQQPKAQTELQPEPQTAIATAVPTQPIAAEPIKPAIVEPIKPIVEEPVVEQLQSSENILTKVKGIGEKRATQLNAIGVRSIQDLANASPKDLAAKLNISPKITRKWVDNAKETGQNV